MKKRIAIIMLIFAVITIALSACSTPSQSEIPVLREPKPTSPLSPPPMTPVDEALEELKGRQYEYSEFYSTEAVEDSWQPNIIELYLDTDSRYESSNTGRFTLVIGLAADINVNAKTKSDAIHKKDHINVPEVDDMWLIQTIIGTYERKENRSIDDETYVLRGYIMDAVMDAYMPAPDGSNPDRIVRQMNINTSIYFSYDYDTNAVKVWSFGETSPGGTGYFDWFIAENFMFDTNPLLLTSSQNGYSRIFYPDTE